MVAKWIARCAMALQCLLHATAYRYQDRVTVVGVVHNSPSPRTFVRSEGEGKDWAKELLGRESASAAFEQSSRSAGDETGIYKLIKHAIRDGHTRTLEGIRDVINDPDRVVIETVKDYVLRRHSVEIELLRRVVDVYKDLIRITRRCWRGRRRRRRGLAA